jgi:cell division transport system ATP-binding protein
MIVYHHVSKRYPGSSREWALRDIDLQIEAGEMVFFLGPSGAGKTTLLRLVTMEERPTQGWVRVLGVSSETVHPREIPRLRRQMGVVYQDFRLLPDKTVWENVAYALRMTGCLDPKVLQPCVNRLLQRVGILHKRHAYPEELSGGEQQRAALARALIHEPSIVLADEPTGNLDPEMGREIMDILKQLQLRGTTVVVASHNEELARAYGQRLIRLEDGRIQGEERIAPGPRVFSI